MPTVSGMVYDSAAAPAAGRIVRAYRRDTGVLLGATVSSDGNIIPGDADYASVGVLLRFQGANGSTSFPDESPTPKTVTRNGNVVISNAQSKWATVSGYFDGSGDTLTLAHNSVFDVTTQDFTVECFVRFDSVGVARIFVTKRTATGFAPYSLECSAANKFTFWTSDGTSTNTITGTTTIVANTWYHVAGVRNGTTYTLYVDGTSEASATIAPARYSNASDLFIVGGTSGGTLMHAGYMNSVRFTKGVARYTGSSPGAPAAEFLANLFTPATPLGSYSIDLGGYASEINVIALDDVAGSTENDLIHRTTGV